jgi:hypothetical protein
LSTLKFTTNIKTNEVRDFTETYYWNKIDITNVRRFVNITLMNTPYFLETINEIANKSFNIFFLGYEFKKDKRNPNLY